MDVTDLLLKYDNNKINIIRNLLTTKQGFEKELDNAFEIELTSYKTAVVCLVLTKNKQVNIHILLKTVNIKNNNILDIINNHFDEEPAVTHGFDKDIQTNYVIRITPVDKDLRFSFYKEKIAKIIDDITGQACNKDKNVIDIINNELKKYNDRLNYLRANITADKREPIKVQAYIEALVKLKYLLLGGK